MEDDFDWGAWLDSQAGSAPPQGSYDIDALLTGYMADPSLSGFYSIDDPANYPRSTDNPAGYDPRLPYNQPPPADLSKLFNTLKSFGGKALNFAGTDRGLMTILAALASAADRQKPRGGGTTMAYPGAKQYTRTVGPGAGGTPIARYAANGGLMQAYAGGGHVQMEDGGFVMTKKAVDGAGGPGGIQQLVPGARMIRGPGTGTSDSIPAVINGRNGQTPARLSNGEAYVPPGHDTQKLYALMHSLERKA